MKLTEHFQLSEFTRSTTADRLAIVNLPDDCDICRLRNLCDKVLEPLRQWYGKPIVISSGFRSAALNKAVGGVSNSQHLKGEAADLHLPNLEIGLTWFNYIEHNLPFDQLILEHDKNGNTWIHVSCLKQLTANRHQVIRSLEKK